MALDVLAALRLLQTRDIFKRELVRVVATIDEATTVRDQLRDNITKIDAALRRFPIVIDTEPVPPAATIDEVIARLEASV